MPRPKAVSKSPKEMGQIHLYKHKRSPRIFVNFLKFLEVKQSIIRGGREVKQLWVDVEYT